MSESTTTPNKQYIGDGVYVSVDFNGVLLETERSSGRHWIVLEPEVYAALVAYVDRIKAGGR